MHYRNNWQALSSLSFLGLSFWPDSCFKSIFQTLSGFVLIDEYYSNSNCKRFSLFTLNFYNSPMYFSLLAIWYGHGNLHKNVPRSPFFMSIFIPPTKELFHRCLMRRECEWWKGRSLAHPKISITFRVVIESIITLDFRRRLVLSCESFFFPHTNRTKEWIKGTFRLLPSLLSALTFCSLLSLGNGKPLNNPSQHTDMTKHFSYTVFV